MSDPEYNYISLQDNSDRAMSESENKENIEEGQQQAPQKQGMLLALWEALVPT
jgi:hypothetical protein